MAPMDSFTLDPLTGQPANRLDMPDILLLAAGLGTRMRPITFEKPKALVEVAGKPLIDHVIDAALAEGCTRFAVNAHHKAEQIERHIEALAGAMPEFQFSVSREKDRLLDTGGGLRNALALLGSDPVFSLNTDSFWLAGADRPLTRMYDRFEAGDADIVLLCVPPENATGFTKGADFMLGPGGALTANIGRPVVYAGAALIKRGMAQQGPAVPFSLYRHFAAARDAGRLKGVVIETQWYHVGDPAAIARTEQAIGALV